MFEVESDQHKLEVPRAAETDVAPERAGRGAGARPSASHLDASSLLHLQRTVGNAGVLQMLADEQAGQQEETSPVHDVVGKGGGASLDESTRSTMESRFGQDFGDVRVHTDAKASESAEAVGANAYTVGNDVVFRSGHFDASSPTGQRTIAHELSHVVQQRSGPVDGTDAPGGIRLSDPSDKFERAADSTADQVMSNSGPSASAAAAAPATATSVQLEAEDDAAASVQRGISIEGATEEQEEEQQT